MDDLLSEFLTETGESLDTVNLELVKLEQDPNNKEVLSNIFRLVHTIKGTCGFLGLPRLEAVAHASENVLGKFRDGVIRVTPAAVTLILESLDAIKVILTALERTEAEPEGDDLELIARLNAHAEGNVGGAEAAHAAAAPQSPAPAAKPPIEAPLELKILQQLDRPLRPGEVSLDELERAFQEAEGPSLTPPPAPVAAAPAPSRPADVPVEPAPAAAVAAPPAPARKPKAEEDEAAKGGTESSLANQTIRVSVELLENLMTMVSELVLTRNQLLQMVRRMGETEFKTPLQRLSHVTSELQEGVMKTRMQPIGNAWQKLPRIVRDLSLELGKKINLQMLGAETELDRQVLELIKDPLTHMVRNSADHGLERPDERKANGKSETGRITLNAYHEGGHIIIEIADDGRGLSTARIKQKILANGLATESEIEGMTESQIHRYIFAAGFSTAEKVTSVSGRGVGMDVVRTNIEKIGGSVDLRSKAGQGSTFMIKIPLTLAIVSALIVESCGQRYAIPQIAVVELVRASADSEHRIERLNDTPVLRLRDRLLPLVNLSKILRLDQAQAEEKTSDEDFVIVAQVGTHSFGIVVDRVFDTEEIVVKPVAPILRDIPLFSGNTILGDGSVIMILDPNGIAEKTGGDFEQQSVGAVSDAMTAEEQEKISLLIFRAGGDQPKAVPLSLIARLEELEVENIEQTNDRYVVQYRGKLMPLVKVNENVPLKTQGRQPILVFTDDTRAMGLAVDEVVDIVEDRLQVELVSALPGILGSAIIKNQATDVIDVGHYLVQGFADWFSRNSQAGSGHAKPRILLVDDSPFFLNMIGPLLQVSGYDVTQTNEPAAVLKMRDEGRMFDAIISDIEMPGMTGFELAEAIRREGPWTSMPIIALSARSTPQDFERGRQVGFTDYVVKFDRDALLATLSETLGLKTGEAA
jgi:two-component system chemotaxis sensor kinase CheA